MKRTIAEIGKRYDAAREAILQGARDGRASASSAGIEHYPKPWAELDMADDFDASIISAQLTWDGKRHDHEGLRKYTPEELRLLAELGTLFYESTGPARNAKMQALDEQITRARVSARSA